MNKDDQIKEKVNVYLGLCDGIDQNRLVLASDLCDKLAFMDVTLTELQNQINIEGAVIESTNGNGFKVINEHPASKTYNTMIKNYNATIKALCGILEDSGSKDVNPVLDFIKR